MPIRIFNIADDEVITSKVGLGESDYEFALKKILPQINKFSEQRKLLDTRFYDRLEKDIIAGCLMPTLTIAFVDDGSIIKTESELEDYIELNINNCFVLDGIQRLNTLKRASVKEGFDSTKSIFFNVIVSKSKDRLLYRMITLNNGQKPMTARHQIEILTQELFNFESIGLIVQTEKQKAENPIKGAYSLSILSLGYISFLTSHVHNENSKIIEEKMDEILVKRILDTDFKSSVVQYESVIHYVKYISENASIKSWLQISNNYIGFCAGIKKSFEFISTLQLELVQEALEKFDVAFKIVNPSKVNLGKYRRELSKHYIENAEKLFDLGTTDLAEVFIEITITE